MIFGGPAKHEKALPPKLHSRSVKCKSLETNTKIKTKKKSEQTMMQRALTVREAYAQVYPHDVEADGNEFWQRLLRALEDILPAKISVDQ